VSHITNYWLSSGLLVLLSPCGFGLFAILKTGFSVWLLTVSVQTFFLLFLECILGPLLFLIYIGDLPSAIKFAKAFLFTDDTKCYKRIMDTIDIHHLQEDINCIFSWNIKDNLLLNLSKCIFMQFNSSQRTSYHINNSTLLPVTSHKDLGVIFSSDLKWNHHYEYIIAKSFKILGLLRRYLSSNNYYH